MTGDPGPGDCAGCGHAHLWHLGSEARPCMALVYRHIAGNSGPGTSIPRPCPCTGYTPRKVTMMPEPAAPAVPAPATPAAAEVRQILLDLDQAWTDMHNALLKSHAQWAAAITASHDAWKAEIKELSARLAQAAGGPQDGGPQ